MPRSWIHHLVIAGVLFGFWVVLSGRLEMKYFIFGAIVALGVTFLSAGLLYTEAGSEESQSRRWLTMMPWHRLVVYIPWLALEIVKANFLMIPLILGPRRRLQPRIFTFKTTLKLEVAKVAFGNSITLTPGTLTCDVSPEGEYTVHAIDEGSQLGVLSRKMEKMVAWAFGDPGRPSDIENVSSADEKETE